MVKFPKTITYTDTNAPEWITVMKENTANPFSIQITIKSWNELEFITSNVEAVLIDLQKAIQDTGLSVQDVYALIGFIRFTARNIILTVDGTGIDLYEIILPPGLSVTQVRKATGELVPFFFNAARNSVVFNVEFHSVETIYLVVGSIQNLLNSTIQTISTIMIVTGVLNIVMKEFGKILEEVREKV